MSVSIITPTYNRSDVLPRAARSVFEQTYDPVEYIIVDDGSSDDTAAVVEQFDYPNLKYIKFEENQGVSTARNRGVKAAEGQFVMFVDADDELPESAVSMLVDELNTAPESCAGVFGQRLHYKSTGDVEHSTYDGREVHYTDLIEWNCMGAFGGKLLRRRLFNEIGWIDPLFPSSEDFDFFIRAAAAGYYFRYIDKLTYNKHYPDDRLYGNTTQKIVGLERVLDKHGDKLTPSHRAYRTRLIGHTHAERSRMNKASDSFRECIAIRPFDPDCYLLFILSKLRIYNTAYALKSWLGKRT